MQKSRSEYKDMNKYMNVLLSVFSTVWMKNKLRGSLCGSVWREALTGSECGKPGRLC